MSIRTKTKKRLLILLTCVVVLGGGLTAFVAVRLAQRERQAQEHREAGLDAAKNERYVEALEHLSEYRPDRRDDAEALYQFGVARRHVELPQGRHLRPALRAFQGVLELEPDHKQARHELLELYVQVHHNVETIELADQILAENPADVEALRSKTIALGRQRNFDQALEVAERLIEAAPDDLRAHTLTIEIMRGLDRPGDQVIEHVETLREERPDDPQFDMLLGYVHGLNGNREQSTEWLRRAAERDPTNAEFVVRLVSYLDGLGLFSEAMALLEEHAADFDDPRVQRMLVRRLWENNRSDDVLAHLADLNAASDETDGELLGLKALALSGAGRAEEARGIIAALDDRQGDNAATAWATALEAVTDSSRDAQEKIEACRTALAADPANPYIRFFLAEAYAGIQETELAIQEWHNASELAPTWSRPLTRISQAYTRTNRSGQALPYAQAAVRRSPRSKSAIISFAQARAEALEAGVPTNDSPQELAELLGRVQEAEPGEPQTLPLYIDNLANLGRSDEASQALDAALEDEGNTPPEQTLIQLVSISREHGFGLEDKALQLSEETHGLTPRLAYAKAMQRAVSETPEAGLAYLQDVMSEGDRENEVVWQAVWARFLEAADAERAAEAWIALAEQHPDNRNAQRMALEADSVRGDREFIDRTIDRLQSLSDEEGISWRLARARWLLAGDDSEGETARAVGMLNEILEVSPDLLEARLLLAAAHEKADNLPGATEQLALASELQPRNMSIQLELAQLHMDQGRYGEASSVLDGVVAGGGTTAEQRRRAASMLAEMGESDRAISVLTQAGGSGGETPPASVILAQLYQRRNEMEQANEVYRELMKRPTPQAIQSYADFLGSLGRHDDAIRVLASLQDVGLDAGVYEMVLGRYHQRHGQVDEAAERYRAAVEAVPDNPTPRRLLIGLYMEEGRIDDALAANESARQALPDEELFSLLYDQRELIGVAGEDSRLRPLAAAVVDDSAHREAAIEAMELIRSMEEMNAAELRELDRLANDYPRFLALQNLTAEVYMNAGRPGDAADIATRAMEAFPTEASPAEKATLAFRAQQDWNGVLTMARQWRERALHQALRPDLTIADAYLQLGDPDRALEQIEPYRDTALEAPGRLPNVIRLQSRALVMAGQADRAATLLKPLLDQDPGWRSLWVSLAVDNMEDAATSAGWLERVAPVIPADSVREHIFLANAWFSLGERADEAEYRQRGLDMLRSLAEEPDADARTVLAYAVKAQEQGDADTAETQYRRVLEIQPDMAIAQNNLAILLTDEGGDMDEAARLARAAQEANPNVATFYDTLAYVQAKRERYDEAIASLEQALRLEPGRTEWRVNLASAHADNGDREEAQRLLREIEARGVRQGDLSPRARDRLQKLRDTLGDAQAAASAP